MTAIPTTPAPEDAGPVPLTASETHALLTPTIPDVLTPPLPARPVFGARTLLLLAFLVISSIVLMPETRKALIHPLLQLISGSGQAVLMGPFLEALLTNVSLGFGLAAVGAAMRGLIQVQDHQLYNPEWLAKMRADYSEAYAKHMAVALKAQRDGGPLYPSDAIALRAAIHQHVRTTSLYGTELCSSFSVQGVLLCVCFAAGAALVAVIRADQVSMLAVVPDAAWVLFGLGVAVALAWGYSLRLEGVAAIGQQLGDALEKPKALPLGAVMLLLVGFGVTLAALQPEPEREVEYKSAELASLTYVEDVLTQCLSDMRQGNSSPAGRVACDHAAAHTDEISQAFLGQRSAPERVSFAYEADVSSVTLQAYTLVTPQSKLAPFHRPTYRVAGVLPAKKPSVGEPALAQK